MKYLLALLILYPLLSFQRTDKSKPEIDNNSYITNFELLKSIPPSTSISNLKSSFKLPSI